MTAPRTMTPAEADEIVDLLPEMIGIDEVKRILLDQDRRLDLIEKAIEKLLAERKAHSE